ncbi:Disease resistance protein L6 [Linum grandiflorum]
MWSGEGTTVSNASSQSQTSITAEQQSVASALEYEVFLSFRGPDVRKSFADFLYSYLVHSKIRTFRDEEELRKGETIAPSLIQAITESKIYIPILSKSYASSKWCLQELAKMVECCRKGKGRVILPIFYFMDPRDVRHQAGPYEDAFEQHSKKHDPITVQEWRTALQEVGQMKGWHVTEIDGQGAIVDELFSKVELHLRSNYTLVTEELVGIDSHVQEVMRLLNLDSRDEKIVGIQGIGGMGKTTIAKAVYDNICTNFNRCCFLENIRELLLKNDGIESLQNKFISSILRDDVRVKDASEGVNMIRERVCKYKVLVVLDDVDDKFEFDQILGKLGHFSSESRFIITTRDKRVLELLPECKLYEPEEMSHAHSVQLFSRHAFGMHYIPEGYGALCDEFVKVAAKLPLALKVIGSLLFRRDRQFWEEKLMQLKEVPGTIDKVQQRLKISYNELTYEEKQIFLDIACFFIGEDKELPVHMWSDCKFYPESGIRTLVLRSLIKIDEINRFWMHDHLRDLGRAVVTEEDVECPSKRSRIWSSADAMNMLKNGEATDRVEMLRVDPPWGYYGEIKCFEKLSRLRYLDINVGDFSEILPDLRWLRLSYCNYFHSEFNLKNVVILELPDCKLSDNWRGWKRVKVANKLKVINLRNCSKLKRVPDLSQCASLESIDLTHCVEVKGELNISGFRNLKVVRLQETEISLTGNMGKLQKLEEIRTGILAWGAEQEVPMLPSSLKRLTISSPRIHNLLELKDLEELYFENCDGAPEIPGDAWKLTKLKTLKMVKCICHGSLLLNPDGMLPSSLTCLVVDWSGGLTRLPNLGNLSNLMELRLFQFSASEIHGLGKLRALEALEISKSMSLDHLHGLENLVHLKELILKSCGLKGCLPNLSKMNKLHKLVIVECPLLSEIQGLGDLEKLEKLDLGGCVRLVDIPGLDRLGLLQRLDMCDCRSIEELPDISDMKSLYRLDVSECLNLVTVIGIGKLESLRELYMINCRSIKELSDMSGLKNLLKLNLKGCTNLKNVKGLEKLKTLTCLVVDWSGGLTRLPNLGSLQNLKELCISGWRQFPEFIEFGRLKSLQTLEMKDCKSLKRLSILSSLENLETLDLSGCVRLVDIPGLDRLGSLQKLNMSNCRSIEELPDISDMKSLNVLDVSECFNLVTVIGIEKLESLRELYMVNCRSIKELPDMSGLKNLLKLNLKGCTNLKNVKGLKKLKRLYIVRMEKRLQLKHPLQMVVWAGRELEDSTSLAIMLLLV